MDRVRPYAPVTAGRNTFSQYHGHAAAFGRPSYRNVVVRGSSASGHVMSETFPRDTDSAVALFRFLRPLRASLGNLRDQSAQCFPWELGASLQRQLSALRTEDLGIDRLSCMAALRDARSMGVGYQEVYSCPEMTVCIFVMRAGASIPMHDHPGMQVFGRLLFGRMKVLSADIDVNSLSPKSSECVAPRQRAILRGESVLGPAPVTYSLGPRSGNLHELHAIDDCAFLDVITPPYDEHAGRDCSYFRLERCGDSPGYVLVPTTVDFFVTTLPYRGPSADNV